MMAKSLILYNTETGEIISIQSPVEHDNYGVLVTEIHKDKQLLKIEDNNPIYAEPKEILEKRERLEVLLQEASNLKQDLLEYEVTNLNEN